MAKIDAVLGADGIRLCADPAVARDRADLLVRFAGLEEQDGFWFSTLRPLLASYLMAAGLAGASAADLVRWVEDPAEEMPLIVLRMYAATVPEAWVTGFEQYTRGPAHDLQAALQMAVLTAISES